jgi:large subunit ribosomal protein L9
MQIILLEKVANLGQLGDIVKVREGFARNYLIPKGKAKRATPANVAEFEQRRAELEKAQTDVLSLAQERAAKLEGLMVQITQKAGVDGRLFGSVTNYDIAQALKAQGFEVAKGVVRLPHGPLKQIGDYDIVLDLHADVKASIKVSVLGEQ